jgi:hypothetical protein
MTINRKKLYSKKKKYSCRKQTKKYKSKYVKKYKGGALNNDVINAIFDRLWNNLIAKSECFPIDKGFNSIRAVKRKEIEKYITPFSINDDTTRNKWVDFFMKYRIIIYLCIFIRYQMYMLSEYNPESVALIQKVYHNVLHDFNFHKIDINSTDEEILDSIKSLIRVEFELNYMFELNSINDWHSTSSQKNVALLNCHGITNYKIAQVPQNIVICYLSPINYVYSFSYEKYLSNIKAIKENKLLLKNPNCIKEFDNACFFYPNHYYFDIDICPTTHYGVYSGFIIQKNDNTEIKIELTESLTLSAFIQEHIKELKDCVILVEACRPFPINSKLQTVDAIQDLIYNYESLNREFINAVIPCTEKIQIKYQYSKSRLAHIPSKNYARANTLKSCTGPKLLLTEADFQVITVDELNDSLKTLTDNKTLITYYAYSMTIDDESQRAAFCEHILNKMKATMLSLKTILTVISGYEVTNEIELLFRLITKFNRYTEYTLFEDFICGNDSNSSSNIYHKLQFTQYILAMFLSYGLNIDFFNNCILKITQLGNSLYFKASKYSYFTQISKKLNDSNISVIVTLINETIKESDKNKPFSIIYIRRLLETLQQPIDSELTLIDKIIELSNPELNREFAKLKDKLSEDKFKRIKDDYKELNDKLENLASTM